MTGAETVESAPLWQRIYAHMQGMSIGDVLRYDVITELIGPGSRSHFQHLARRAGAEMERRDSRVIEAVPLVGYRIVEPSEQIRLAKSRQRRARRELDKAKSKVVHIDRSGLDETTCALVDVMAAALSAQVDFTRRLDVRQRRLEAAVAAVQSSQERSEADLTDLRARLERLERSQEPRTTP